MHNTCVKDRTKAKILMDGNHDEGLKGINVASLRMSCKWPVINKI